MWTHTFLEETIIFQAWFVRAANKYLEGSPGPVELVAIQQAKWVGKLSTAMSAVYILPVGGSRHLQFLSKTSRPNFFSPL